MERVNVVSKELEGATKMIQKHRLRAQAIGLLSGCIIFGGGIFIPATSFAGPSDNPMLLSKKIQFEGNNVLTSEALQKALQGFFSSHQGIVDAQSIQDVIYSTYKDAGYTLVSIKVPQDINTVDTLHIVVNEIKINHVTVSGNKQSSEKDILIAIPALQEGKSPNIAKMSSQMLLANENPNRHIAIDIRPLGNGLADAIVNVQEEKSRHYTFSADNTGNDLTGQDRFNTTIFDSNINGRGHMASLSYTTSPDEHLSQVTQLGLFYQMPLPQAGDNLYFVGNYFNSDSGQIMNQSLSTGESLFSMNAAGKGTAFGAHYLHNLQRSDIQRQTLDLGLDVRNYDNTTILNVLSGQSVQNIGVNISTMPLSVTYQNSSKHGNDAVSYGIDYVHNIPGTGRNSTSTYDLYRAGTTANYQVWRYNAGYQHQFDKGWFFNSIFQGQYTNERLIYPEQFGLGGMHSVRGLTEQDVSTDNGSRLSLEVYTPEIAPGQRLLAFVDGGKYDNNDPAQGEITNGYVASYGIGWRYADKNGFALNADLATVIKGTVKTPDHTMRLHVLATKTI